MDQMEIREMIKSLTSGITITNDEINNVKELISKKANFSDVVHYIEAKADRHDVKELKNKMEEKTPSNPILTRQLSDTIHTQIERSLIDSPLKQRGALKSPRT